ncbi:MAG: hypothetical protein Q8O37_04860 [Sulfuricellaceae bacterium]|nr:hypothetical protein [Sulfuricellaceae bacterium]
MPKRIPASTPNDAVHDPSRVIERPDGFYWQNRHDGKTYGPFPSLLDARQDMEYNDDSDYEPGETLEQAEAEIGIADWIDPDTGLPGEESHHLNDY